MDVFLARLRSAHEELVRALGVLANQMTSETEREATIKAATLTLASASMTVSEMVVPVTRRYPKRARLAVRWQDRIVMYSLTVTVGQTPERVESALNAGTALLGTIIETLEMEQGLETGRLTQDEPVVSP